MKEESADIGNREGALPTYEESLTPKVFLPSSQTSLPQHLSTTRNARIAQLFNTQIYPYLYEQALSGLAKSTLVLVPSNITSLQPTPTPENKTAEASQFPGEMIIGFPSEDHVTLLRLQGEENTLEFWRQPSVVRELGTHARLCLKETGHDVRNADDELPIVSPPPNRIEPTMAKRGFFRRKTRTSTESDNMSSTSSSNARVVGAEPLSEDKMRIKVGVQDVCLRTVTDLGLYETKSGKAVVIRIEVGT